jgi:hypothetical protein
VRGSRPGSTAAVAWCTDSAAPHAVANTSDPKTARRTDANHHDFGLVVDTREAPLRNDKAFEQTMPKLRVELTSRFPRTAVLFDSPLGELQVSRLERDEGRNTFITRSVSAAFASLRAVAEGSPAERRPPSLADFLGTAAIHLPR